jgi:cytochrome c peroxidase
MFRLSIALVVPIVLLGDPSPRVRIPRGLPDGLAATLEAEVAEAELGGRLFRSSILSADRAVACVSCHDPGRGFARNERYSQGVPGRITARNVPTILNRALGERQMWDGRAATLEQQVLMPIEHPDEMGLPLPEAIARLAEDREWREGFERVFSRPPDRDALAAALAAFVRSQLVGDSPIDAFRAGEFEALSDSARQGLWLFESRANCWKCHSGPNFSDEDFHATGVGAVDGKAEAGRFAVTGDEADRGRFKTPTLRALRFTAPYMHDGSLRSLAEVVAFYSRGGDAIETRDPSLERLDLSATDQANLVAFLEALSDTAPAK